MYFLTARKVHLFGIQNEANGEQTNYVLDEHELLDKGPNGTLSLVFDAIKKLNQGEKHLKLTCDNAVGQNKNNITLWFCLYLVITGFYESVELNFMIAGHTKFKVDGNFGMIKKRYQKSTIYTKEQFVEIVEKSSPAELNKVQCYEEGRGFQYFDFKVLEKYFSKLPKIGKYHHFLELDCSNNCLTNLKVNNCLKLKEIDCSYNQLTTLNVSNLEELEKLICFNNYLTQITYPSNPEKITELVISNNHLSPSNLTIFSQFRNLERLEIGDKDKNKINQNIYNHFYGSLEPLRDLNELEVLNISNTDLNSG
jgi:hypothetical protein